MIAPSDPEGVAFVVTCEHAGREVPEPYAGLFATPDARAALDSHRGWDPGAIELAEVIRLELGAGPVVAQHVTRLLVECNRSLGHPRLFSEFSAGLAPDERGRLVERYWRPHRAAVARAIDAAGPGLIVHVGVHTFTPVWAGRRRPTRIGLLHDPRRPLEARLARAWRRGILEEPVCTGLAVHLNRPYRGWTDGLVTTLRGSRPPDRYVGFELEIRQDAVHRLDQAQAVARALGAAARPMLPERRVE